MVEEAASRLRVHLRAKTGVERRARDSRPDSADIAERPVVDASRGMPVAPIDLRALDRTTATDTGAASLLQRMEPDPRTTFPVTHGVYPSGTWIVARLFMAGWSLRMTAASRSRSRRSCHLCHRGGPNRYPPAPSTTTASATIKENLTRPL